MGRDGFRLLFAVCAAVFAVPVAAAERGLEVYCPTLRWVLLVAPGGSAVQVIDVGRAVTPLATLRSRQRGPVVALEVQSESRRVWVLTGGALDVHDGFSGRLLGHWSAPDGVRLDRLENDAAGGVSAWSGTRGFVAVTGAAALVPLGARVSWR